MNDLAIDRMNQLAIDYEALAREGMKRAADHADAIEPGWSLLAYGMLEEFCKVRHGCVATSEDIRRWCGLRGFESPVPKAWGAVFKRAAKVGIIRKSGIAVAKERHGSPTVQWTVA